MAEPLYTIVLCAPIATGSTTTPPLKLPPGTHSGKTAADHTSWTTLLDLANMHSFHIAFTNMLQYSPQPWRQWVWMLIVVLSDLVIVLFFSWVTLYSKVHEVRVVLIFLLVRIWCSHWSRAYYTNTNFFSFFHWTNESIRIHTINSYKNNFRDRIKSSVISIIIYF